MKLTPDKRPKDVEEIDLTERDLDILKTIHSYDDLMGDYQLLRLFFGSWTRARNRLKQLWENGYLARPDRRSRAALPCMIYWLDKQGKETLTHHYGIDPNSFLKFPRQSQIQHDLDTNDFWLNFCQAVQQSADFKLVERCGQNEFYSYPDEVTYFQAGQVMKRQVQPDGYAAVDRGKRRFRFLLEYDRGTESNIRIGREKVIAGIKYIDAPAYKIRFGHNSGCWLYVTTSMRRLENLKKQIEQVAGEARKIFYFTTADLAQVSTVFEYAKAKMDSPTSEQQFPDVTTLLTEPIWYHGGEKEPRSLME